LGDSCLFISILLQLFGDPRNSPEAIALRKLFTDLSALDPTAKKLIIVTGL
jgi:hypothetical protein